MSKDLIKGFWLAIALAVAFSGILSLPTPARLLGHVGIGASSSSGCTPLATDNSIACNAVTQPMFGG
jgi:hypothetical protein